MFPVIFDSASSLVLFGLSTGIIGFAFWSWMTYKRTSKLVSSIHVTVKSNG